LVQKGADINTQSNDGMSALTWACHKGHLEIAEFLMRNRAKIHFTDDNGDTAFDLLDVEGNTLSDAEKDRLRALPMLIKKEWWSVRGDLDLFRYQAGFVPVPEVDRSSAEVTAMWTGYKNLEAENKSQIDEISIHKARIQAHAARISNLMAENDRLRRELEAMKNDMRRGRVLVIDHTDTIANTKEAEEGEEEGFRDAA
jgi:ankyrin repeat protein